MQINDRMEQLHNAVSQTYIAVEPDGPGNCGKQERGRSREIVCEHFLDVYVDEQLTFRLTCNSHTSAGADTGETFHGRLD